MSYEVRNALAILSLETEKSHYDLRTVNSAVNTSKVNYFLAVFRGS